MLGDISCVGNVRGCCGVLEESEGKFGKLYGMLRKR